MAVILSFCGLCVLLALGKYLRVKVKKPCELSNEEVAGLYPVDARPPAGHQTVTPDSVDALALHVAVVGIAILIGFGIKQVLAGFETHVLRLAEGGVMKAFPLFPLCMIGGVIVQLLVSRYSRVSPIDRGLMQRLAGTALDFLVVAAISTIRLEVIWKLFLKPRAGN